MTRLNCSEQNRVRNNCNVQSQTILTIELLFMYISIYIVECILSFTYVTAFNLLYLLFLCQHLQL